MKRDGFTLLEALGVLVLVMILAAILFPIFARSRDTGHGPSCPNNLKQVALGMKQYIGDYDEKYPPVSVHSTKTGSDRPFGWAGGIQPYTKSIQVLQCPSEPTGPVGADKPDQVGYTDYWYNANCARQEEKNFAYVSQTALLGDGAIGGGDARYSVTHEVNTTEETSRHQGGNSFAFADGHVKWLKPGSISATESPDKEIYSFKLK